MSKKNQNQDKLEQVCTLLYEHLHEIDGLPPQDSLYGAVVKPTIKSEVEGLVERLTFLIGSKSKDW